MARNVGVTTRGNLEPCPPDLWPRVSPEPTTTTVVVSAHSNEEGEVKFTFVQLEPSGRVMEFEATLTSCRLLRDVVPARRACASALQQHRSEPY
jgi:hypothetical protein